MSGIEGTLFQAGRGAAFSVKINAGASASAVDGGHTFSTNTPTLSGGTGPYTYAWSETNNGLGTWTPTTATTASITPAVSGAVAGNVAVANYILVVTDTSDGATATSNTASYSYFNNSNPYD